MKAVDFSPGRRLSPYTIRICLESDIYCYDDLVITPMTLIILTLATMRLTRIIVWDKITMPLRRTAIRLLGTGHWAVYLLHCVTCTGFWAAAAVVGAWMLWPNNPWLTGIYIALAVAETAPRLLNWQPRTNTGGE